MNYSPLENASRRWVEKCELPSRWITLPDVTVIITCFNYAQFVTQALDSVAGQTYKNFDCVIVDDGSTDQSVQAIEQWIALRNDPRFRCIRRGSNEGQMASFSAGLAASRGEFVAFLDADDVWFPEYLERHIEVHLNSACCASVSCSDLVQINAEGKILRGSYVGLIFETRASGDGFFHLEDNDLPHVDASNGSLEFRAASPVKYIWPAYLEGPWNVTSGMVFRRAALDLVMPRDLKCLPICADGYIFSMCHFFTGSLAFKRVMAAYRRHGRNHYGHLPILTGKITPVDSEKRNREAIVSAMLRHTLDQYNELAIVFSAATVRNLIRRLFRHSLREGMQFEDRRLNEFLGNGRVFRDRMRSKIKSLRRKLL
jgi:glycosyltransferase involved in cell wall biosynthesis